MFNFIKCKMADSRPSLTLILYDTWQLAVLDNWTITVKQNVRVQGRMYPGNVLSRGQGGVLWSPYLCVAHQCNSLGENVAIQSLEHYLFV